VSLDTERRVVKVAGPDGEQDLAWDDLVLATGASPRRLECQPDHPRVVSFHVWDDLEPLRAGLMRGEIDRVALVGAGLVTTSACCSIRPWNGSRPTTSG
jgi:NADPH-dependent 2,4-dienoyl-CoA reductase/sulfur reductase-like enzyme